MTWFLSFLASEQSGILVLLLVLAVAGGFLNWILWMCGVGRFRPSAIEESRKEESKIRYVLANFFVKVIDDFRNLLALIVVMLFAVALFTAMWPGIRMNSVDKLKDGLQAVAAALGGLIGSIIGYYFGESAGKSKLAGIQGPPVPAGPVVQGPRSVAPAGPEPITEPKKPVVG